MKLIAMCFFLIGILAAFSLWPETKMATPYGAYDWIGEFTHTYGSIVVAEFIIIFSFLFVMIIHTLVSIKS